MPDDATQEDKEAPEKKVGRDVWLGLAISFGILLVIFLIAGLYLFVGPTTPTQKKDFVQAVGVLVAGIAGVVGLFFTWRNLRLTRENTERQLQVAREGQERTQEATRETLRITEQGQITERFTRAIDQLGATDDGKPKLEIRLGGIYALERIAKDSPKKYYATIMEVLMAYVRENARLPSEEATKPPLEQHATAERSVPAEQQSERAERSSASAPQKKPRVDIQAVLNVLGRRDEARVAEEYRLQHDLQKTNLTGADFLEANLREVILSKANLGVANLMRADLSGANLSEANLSEADLREAHLMEANVREANFRGADLTGADLWKAKLRGADFSGAELQRANLQGADLQGADLREAYFWGADLQGADLRGADLRGVNLGAASLSYSLRSDSPAGYVFTGANLQGADLQGADLRGTNFQGFHFPVAQEGIVVGSGYIEGAKGLTQEQLEQAIGDKTTNPPEGLKLPKSWTQDEDNQREVPKQA